MFLWKKFDYPKSRWNRGTWKRPETLTEEIPEFTAEKSVEDNQEEHKQEDKEQRERETKGREKWNQNFREYVKWKLVFAILYYTSVSYVFRLCWSLYEQGLARVKLSCYKKASQEIYCWQL